MKFEELGLSEDLLKGVQELGFEEPSPIQEEAIPVLLSDERDLVALAQTGTGKTAAFGLPLLELTDPNVREVQSVILSPTRELANQIAEDLKKYSKYKKGIKVLSVYGGASISGQIKDLKRGVNVVVATPGRLKDLIERGVANLRNIDRVVLDEADEMLNMGFKQELDYILDGTPEGKSTWLFSATMPREIERIAKNYMSDPFKITVGAQNEGAKNITHKYYLVRHHNRFAALRRIVDSTPDIFGLIFCRTRRDTQEIADRLMAQGYSADAIHGDLSQQQRDRVMDKFRAKKIQLLCATDVAARGIDVDDITHVINYELPDEIESYTHRSGRTARAGKIGESLVIVSDKEAYKIRRIEKIIKKKFEKCDVPDGSEVIKSRLFNLIEQVKSTVVDEKELGKFEDEVLAQFEDLSKEEVIKLFVSKDFNKFVAANNNNESLNSSGGGREGGRDGGRGRDRDRGRGRDRDRDRGGREGGNRRERRDRDGDRAPRGDRGDREDRSNRNSSRNGEFKTFFINLGTEDGVNKGGFIDFICTESGIRGKALGEIRLNDKFTFFEVENETAKQVGDGLKGTSYDGRRLKIELAKPRN
ncbi:MAG: ATP-dependent RNA helicase DeaD [Saprospiraceae bacterium]|jgi:ATP-dependent RNA helicase DeaD